MTPSVFVDRLFEKWQRGLKKNQNPRLGCEHSIRDLNDDINKKLREKHHWNKRINELGRLNFISIEWKQQLEHRQEENLDLQNGYRYFGAAKELPGVKELFAKAKKKAQKRKRGDVYKYITPDYYGWREEEDGVLLELEKEASKRNLKCRKEQQDSTNVQKQEESSSDDDDDEAWGATTVPTQELIAQAILERKKQALLERFA
jgi:pre-mRNA-splicing factor ISY1